VVNEVVRAGDRDDGLRDSPLVRLAGAAISAYAARDYAQMIYDLAVRRELIALGRDIAAKAGKVEVDSEPKEQIIEAEQRLYKLGEQGVAERGFQSFLKAVTQAVDVANAAYQRDGGLAGISTGLIDLDKKLGGLHPSDLLILAGRPSMGKTAFALCCALNAASAGHPVAIFSLEMSDKQIVGRMLANRTGMAINQVLRDNGHKGEFFARVNEAANHINSLPITLQPEASISIDQIVAQATRWADSQQGGKIPLVIVDYLQLVSPSKNARDKSREQQVADISRGLKILAKQIGGAVIALPHRR
jgi:replicative DNA helicase